MDLLDLYVDVCMCVSETVHSVGRVSLLAIKCIAKRPYYSMCIHAAARTSGPEMNKSNNNNNLSKPSKWSFSRSFAHLLLILAFQLVSLLLIKREWLDSRYWRVKVRSFRKAAIPACRARVVTPRGCFQQAPNQRQAGTAAFLLRQQRGAI